MADPENPPADTGPAKRVGTRFKPGQSGNPAGRPKGTRAAVYATLDNIAEEAGPEILEALIQKAKEGDARAADILLRRAWPERKGRPVPFKLRAVQTLDDVAGATADLLAAVAAGDVSPEEAHAVAAILDVHRNATETLEFAKRLAALEATKNGEGQ